MLTRVHVEVPWWGEAEEVEARSRSRAVWSVFARLVSNLLDAYRLWGTTVAAHGCDVTTMIQGQGDRGLEGAIARLTEASACISPTMAKSFLGKSRSVFPANICCSPCRNRHRRIPHASMRTERGQHTCMRCTFESFTLARLRTSL